MWLGGAVVRFPPDMKCLGSIWLHQKMHHVYKKKLSQITCAEPLETPDGLILNYTTENMSFFTLN